MWRERKKKIKDNFYGAKLAKEGAKHLIFLNSFLGKESLGSAEEYYKWVSSQLQDHKGLCPGCTTEAIKAIKQGLAGRVPS